MAISMKLKKFLDENKVNYTVAAHSEVYTAQEIAAALHVRGKELAKVVMVKAGEGFVMTVLPASWRIDIPKLKEVLRSNEVRLATEKEFKTLFCGKSNLVASQHLFKLRYVNPPAGRKHGHNKPLPCFDHNNLGQLLTPDMQGSRNLLCRINLGMCSYRIINLVFV